MRALQNILIYTLVAIVGLAIVIGFWIGVSFIIQMFKSIFDIQGVCPVNALAVIPKLFG